MSTNKPGKTTKRQSTDKRRREFVEIAKALAAEHGVEGLKLREVARRANVSAPAVYNHFSSLEDLTAAMLSEHLDELKLIYDAAARMEPVAGIRHICGEHTRLFVSDPGTTRLIHWDLQSARGLPTHRDVEGRFLRLNAVEAGIMGRGAKAGVFRDVNTMSVILARLGTTLTLLTVRGLGTSEYPEEATQKIVDFVTDMVLRCLEDRKDGVQM